MPIEAKDLITGVGVLGSALIGVRNWIVTNSIRSGTIQLEEFRSQVRGPIQQKLDKLAEVRESLSALMRPNASSDDELKQKISGQLAVLEFAIDDLVLLFEHADASSFAGGSNWKSRYEPMLTGAAKRLGTLTADGPLDRVAAGAAMTDVIREISAVTTELRRRFEHDVQRMIPSGILGRPKKPRRR